MLFDAISYMDAAFIVVLLIYVVIGLFRGLAKQVFSLFGFLAAVVLAVLLCSAVAGWLKPMFGESLEGSFREWIVAKDSGIENEADKLFTVAKNWTSEANVTAALTGLGLPSLLSGMFSGLVKTTFAEFGSSAVLADVLPPVLADWVLVAISFVALLIIFLILIAIIKMFVFKFIEVAHIGWLDKLLGVAGGALQAYVIVSVALTVLLTLLSNVPVLSGIQGFLAEQAQISAGGKFPIFHWIYSNNWIGNWLVSKFA